MRLTFLFFFIAIANSLFAQTYKVNPCKDFVDIKVELENIEPEQDSIFKTKSYGTYVRNCFQFRLTTKNTNYSIERFVLSGEYDNGDVGEISNEGSCFTVATLRLISSLGKGKELYIFCIQAKDKHGKEYVLKPFSYMFQ